MRIATAYLLALVAVLVGAYYGFPDLFQGAASESDASAEARPAPTATPVIVAVARRAPLIGAIEALGTIQARESIEVTPNRADHITAIHFTDGQRVEAGALLVEMNSDEEEALLAEAVAALEERRNSNERIVGLFERSMVSQSDLDADKARLAAAEARVVGLRASIRDRQVRAPFAGVLGLRRVSVGAYVQPATVITTLDDLSSVKLEFTIPETWLPFVRSGMTVRARSDAWLDDVFPGEVVAVDTRLDPRTRSATVLALLPNPDDKLRSGMLAKVQVERDQEPVLQVPEEALIPTGNEQFVLRVVSDDGDTVEKIAVRIGERRYGVVEIVEGLSEGDRVVVEGLLRVRPGSPIQIVGSRETDT